MGVFLRSGASVLAFCAFAAAAPVLAQTAPSGQPSDAGAALEGTAGRTQGADTGDTRSAESADAAAQSAPAADDAIVVTGIRQSLQNAQNLKRNADTIVDAITAEDIGALPDRSVTEALQRVPGVSINRFAGSNDPDHFSGEGSGVVVRGLTYVRSEFNGRDTFSPGVGGQAINFQDVPADMLGSVEVWKNTTAEMIEGGLSGTVNMNLRKPFDNKGFFAGFSAEGVRTDMRKKWSPVFTGVLSNTWDTSAGRFGILGAISYSKLFSRADGVRVTNYQTRDGRYAVQSNETDILACRTPLPGNTNTTGFPSNVDAYFGTGAAGAAFPNPAATVGNPCVGAASGPADGFADTLSTAYAPIGGQFVTQEFNRTRRGFGASAQWESNDRRALVTGQFLRSHATQKWGEYTFEAGGDLNEYNTFPAGCLPNNNGPIQGEPPNQARTPRAECALNSSGQIVGASGTSWQSYPNGQTFPNYTYNEDGVFESGYITLPIGGWRGGTWDQVPQGGMQHTLNRRQVEDTNKVNDFGLNAKFTPNDRWSFNADAQYVSAKHDNMDFGIHGSIFADQELDLTGEYPQVTPHKPLTLSQTWASPSDALRGASDEEYFTNPRYTYWRSAMDHIEQSSGEEWAFRGDAQYNFEEGESFLKHAKFGARYSDRDQKFRYTSYNWGSLSEVWTGNAVHMNEVGGDNVVLHDWGTFFRGKVNAPPRGNYYSGDLIDGYEDAIAFTDLVQDNARANGGGGAADWDPLARRPGAIAGTPFLPTDLQRVREENLAAYAMLSFGREEPIFGNVRLDGNIGLRVVRTSGESEGAVGAPTEDDVGTDDPYEVRCAIQQPPPEAPPGAQPSRPSGLCNLGETGYTALRTFANGEYAQTVNGNKYTYFLPSLNLKFGLSRNLILRFAAGRNLARPGTWDLRTRADWSVTGTSLGATTGNPFLKPAISDNLDASAEWYFGGSAVGSLTFNLFAKNIHNFFFQNVFEEQYTFNGITQNVIVRRPDNYEKTGKIRGLELSYQQTYDFLPGLLNGFGLSANYSYIHSKGLENAQLFIGSRAPIGTAGNLPLEQLSKHNLNIQPFYERGPFSLRLAYTWRSKFLLTASDVIFPYYPIFNDASGRLDATVFIDISKNFKIGVQGVNLTNEVTKTLQQFTVGGLKGPRSYFMEDRRFHFILRGTF
ncbi:TonB-dependent receptor [Allosphingosinicella deserti]|uniref:TonB-dependent receptor n=1 Tax=Allosphingosinicella deserti TaxID=2116704 RepID=UPI001E4DE42A|nr:TonB-dependent receptor [Sphingomonas deserti]